MTITFENDSDVIVYTLEKVITFARETQHLFVANCVWWIAAVIGLDNGLRNYIDNFEGRRRICVRAISTIPGDIARSVSQGPPSEEIVDKEISKLSRNRRRKLATNKNRNRIQKKQSRN